MIQEIEYKQRRDTLASKLESNSVGVLFSAELKIRSNDTAYPYRQNSNFYYLTGLKEDTSSLIFIKLKREVKTYLFVQKKDKKRELWSGSKLGIKEAKKHFLVDEVYDIAHLNSKLKEFLKEKKYLYYDFNVEYSKVKVLKRYSKELGSYINIAKLVNKMRLVKSNSEIDLIEKAISITKKAHHKVMSLEKENKKEYELQAEIEYIFKVNGAYSDAYTSIVACGNSANTLHYIKNDKSLVENQLILIDAGCEYEYYASDITRTIPVSGRFTRPQKKLYNMILDVQEQIIKMIIPHAKKSELQEKSEELLCKGLIELGILTGDCKKLIKKQKHKKYFPHGIGHWMGLDVHDEAPYKNENTKEIAFKEGMILTVEPGIYIDKYDKSVPKKYRGIGIRIEDNILVTKDGHKNLSQNIAKSVEEIETLFISSN